MNLLAKHSKSVIFQHRALYTFGQPCLLFSTNELSAYTDNILTKKRWRKRHKEPPRADHLSWEERLADVVTPLWRLSYEEQLELKQKQQERILCQLSGYLSGNFESQSPCQLGFPVLPVLPSPVRDGYRNKSTFSVNRGIDGNPKTVGFYVGTAREGSIVCVNGDHLLNMPEKHKLVARCYQEFIRLSSLEPCLLFHTGGHWREITVRTNREGHTMAIVYFHPQTLTAEEVAVHKAELVDYFTRGPGSVCQLDSLFFQESSMTRCTHETSPYQLLYGQPHMYEEVIYIIRWPVRDFTQIMGLQVWVWMMYCTVHSFVYKLFEQPVLIRIFQCKCVCPCKYYICNNNRQRQGGSTEYRQGGSTESTYSMTAFCFHVFVSSTAVGLQVPHLCRCLFPSEPGRCWGVVWHSERPVCPKPGGSWRQRKRWIYPPRCVLRDWCHGYHNISQSRQNYWHRAHRTSSGRC